MGKVDFMEELNVEIEKRIDIMEADDYEGVPELQKSDFILTGVLIAVCTLALVFAYNFMC